MRKSKVVKKKKILKRLDRVGELLSKLIDKFSGDETGVRELLNSGRAFVARARASVKSPEKESARPAVKSSAKSKSVAALKRPLTAKKVARVTNAKRPSARSLKSQSSPARGKADIAALASAS